MSSNSKAASLAARLVESNNPNRSRHDSDDDDDALFAELEEEIENDTHASVREHGLRVLKTEMERMKHMQENHYGTYSEITDEKEVVRVSMSLAASSTSTIPNSNDAKSWISTLLTKYSKTRFIRVFVENIPWLVEKLSIKVLPCVICFVDGIAKDRLVGFEELGNEDSFNTAVLELRLAQSGVLLKQQGTVLDPVYKVASRRQNDDNDDLFDL
ncbi:thioredoxin-like protein [Pholiota molesta]|nr:thioredoxin-like protein [Pholiota molesta]